MASRKRRPPTPAPPAPQSRPNIFDLEIRARPPCRPHSHRGPYHEPHVSNALRHTPVVNRSGSYRPLPPLFREIEDEAHRSLTRFPSVFPGAHKTRATIGVVRCLANPFLTDGARSIHCRATKCGSCIRVMFIANVGHGVGFRVKRASRNEACRGLATAGIEVLRY